MDELYTCSNCKYLSNWSQVIVDHVCKSTVDENACFSTHKEYS